MRTTFRSLVSILAVVLLNGFSFAGHASAMPIHEMGGMNHDSSSSANCVTLCQTAVFEKNEPKNKSIDDENDAETATPYYRQPQNGIYFYASNADSLYAVMVRPPPKIPIYILYSVFQV